MTTAALRRSPAAAITACLTAIVSTASVAEDLRPCPAAHRALDKAYVAAGAVANGESNAVFSLMPAALAAEDAAGQAEHVSWPQSIIETLNKIAGQSRELAAESEARTVAAADELRAHVIAAVTEIDPICGASALPGRQTAKE